MYSYGDNERKEDFNFFLENYQNIFKKYGSCFVAIRNKEIIGIFKTEKEAIDITSAQYELGQFIIQQCNGDETGYTNYITSWQLVGV